MTISIMMKTAVGHATDLIKDILLAVMISLSQGGFAKLIFQEQPYIKGVSPFLFLGISAELLKITSKTFFQAFYVLHILFKAKLNKLQIYCGNFQL